MTAVCDLGEAYQKTLNLQAAKRTYQTAVRLNPRYLAAYIGQTLRKELVSADSWKNRSQASRLPAWAKAAGNREEILKAIAKTRASRL